MSMEAIEGGRVASGERVTFALPGDAELSAVDDSIDTEERKTIPLGSVHASLVALPEMTP